jgi:hypothetical protein
VWHLRGDLGVCPSRVPVHEGGGYGKIVNITSSTFWEGVAGLTPCVASKDSDFITCQTLVVDGGRNTW